MPGGELTNTETASCVLIVCPSRSDCETHFETAVELPVKVIDAETCDAVRTAIQNEPEHDVALTALTLPDGNWECVHRAMVERNDTACLIVAAPGVSSEQLQDELTVRGALGLFSEPYRENVHALLSGAWCEGRADRLSRKASAAGAR